MCACKQSTNTTASLNRSGAVARSFGTPHRRYARITPPPSMSRGLTPPVHRPYIYDAVRLLDVPGVFPEGVEPPAGLNFVHFPIVDCDTVSDDKVLQLCNDLVKRLVKGENMYIHCWYVAVR